MRRRAALAAALLSLAGPAAAGPPRCEVEVEVEPARGLVGQQLHYRLRILRRRDVASLEWATPLSFPTFRSEWLPGIAGDARLERDGESFIVFVERRALFGVHAGRLRVPAAALRCGSPEGEEIVTIPSVEIEVGEPPAAGRPEGFSGLLGPVALAGAVTPSRISLGQTVRVSVLLRGDTNLWAAPSPRAALEATGADVFEHPDELARDAGRLLRLRRYFSFDLVPRHAGTLRLPELRVPYFDVQRGVYAEARAQLAPVTVRDAPPPSAAPRAAPAPAVPQSGRRPPWLGMAAALALAIGLGLGLLVRRRRRAPAPASREQEIARRLDLAYAAERRGDALGAAVQAGAALRAALGAAPGAAPEEIAAQLPASGARRHACDLLAQIERARYAAAAPPPPLAEIEASIARLRC